MVVASLFRAIVVVLRYLNTRIGIKKVSAETKIPLFFCKNLGESFERGDTYSGGWGQKSHDPWYIIHPAYPHSIAEIARPKLVWTPCMIFR